MHDTTLTFRLPKVLHEQLEQVANAQYLKMGELVRNLIKDEIKRAQPYITTPSAQPQGKVLNAWEQQRQAMSPAERAKLDAQHEADWG